MLKKLTIQEVSEERREFEERIAKGHCFGAPCRFLCYGDPTEQEWVQVINWW